MDKKTFKKGISKWMLFFFSVMIILSLGFGLRQLIPIKAQVNGNSMNPNLDNNEKVIISHQKDTYNRFDIVVIDAKKENPKAAGYGLTKPDSQDEELYVKRIIGLPGETITSIDGQIYINGHKLKQPFEFIKDNTTWTLSTLELSSNLWADSKINKIPKNSYFVLGDNRKNSLDSRYFGVVSQENITGFIRKDSNHEHN